MLHDLLSTLLDSIIRLSFPSSNTLHTVPETIYRVVENA